VNFTTMSQGSPLSHLPIDPTNTAVSSNFYAFVTDERSWVLASLIESERHGSSARRDGGTDFTRFEVGNNLSLWTNASGLVGYWSFDEGEGLTARDLSGRGNTGTLMNNPTWTTGRVGGALSFDGVDDFVNVGNHASLNPSVFTIEAWVNPTTSAADRIIYTNFVHGLAWESIHLDSASFIMNISNSGPTRNNLSFSLVPATRWTHLVATYDGSWMRVYQNGVEISSRTATGVPWSSPRNFSIGAIPSTYSPPAIQRFHGLIDEVRIYNRALTAAEVRASFNATRQ